MAKKKIEVQVCDNPDCCKEVHPAEPGEFYGFNGGKIIVIGSHGGDSAKEWFACSYACIGPAIMEVTARH